MDTYKDTDCSAFAIKYNTDYDTKDLRLDKKMHKVIAIIQFKLERQIIMRRPEFGMQDRLLFDKIDYGNRTLVVDGVPYAMKEWIRDHRNAPLE